MIEYLICDSCHDEMRVSGLFSKEEKVRYTCYSCNKSKELTFAEAEKLAGNKFEYFILNSDGEVAWKCNSHPGCSINIGSGDKLNEEILDMLYGYECPYCEDESDREASGELKCCKMCDITSDDCYGEDISIELEEYSTFYNNIVKNEYYFCSIDCFLYYLYEYYDEEVTDRMKQLVKGLKDIGEVTKDEIIGWYEKMEDNEEVKVLYNYLLENLFE